MASNPFNLSVGSPVWVFGRSDAPQVIKVTGETSRSWLVDGDVKIPKAHAEPVFSVNPRFGCTTFYCLTREAAEGMALQRARWTMAESVKRCTDAAALQKIAEALGMPVAVPAPSEVA